MLVSALFKQVGSCFGLFDIAGYTYYTYSICKYNIHLHSLQNWAKKFTKGSLFYPFL